VELPAGILPPELNWEFVLRDPFVEGKEELGVVDGIAGGDDVVVFDVVEVVELDSVFGGTGVVGVDDIGVVS
jgi:hypothetical protein